MVTFDLVPCNYVHATVGDSGDSGDPDDSVSEECVADLDR